MVLEPIPFRAGDLPLAPAPSGLGVLDRAALDAFRDDQLLATLLGSGPRAARRAVRALETLRGPSGVVRATPAELRAAGLGWRAAAGVVVGRELARRAAESRVREAWVVRSPADVADRLAGVMASLEREELRVLLLDTKNAVTAAHTVYVGNLAGSSVRVGEVFRDAVRACAAAIVVVHNHPSGDPTPSAEDLRITEEMVRAGRLLDIELIDHVVLGRGRWVSLRSIGLLAH